MTNILNGQDKKQNDSFNFNFTNNNDQDKIEVNMFHCFLTNRTYEIKTKM